MCAAASDACRDAQAAGVADEVAGGAKVAAEFLRPYVEAAAPVVEGAARETVKVATPLVQEGLKSAKRAAQSSGLDVDGAFQSAAAAAKATAPVAQEAASAAVSVTQALINGDPATLTTAAGVGAAVVLLSPLLLPLLARCDARPRVALPARGSDARRSAVRCAATPATSLPPRRWTCCRRRAPAGARHRSHVSVLMPSCTRRAD